MITAGEEVLDKILEELQGTSNWQKLSTLSSLFYTKIPHNLGRSAQQVRLAVLDSYKYLWMQNRFLIPLHRMIKYKEKVDLLQLMKDMLNVSGTASKTQGSVTGKSKANVLYSNDVKEKYSALNCAIVHLDEVSPEYFLALLFFSTLQV